MYTSYTVICMILSRGSLPVFVVSECAYHVVAFLQGQLPFDDDNLRILLEKVKKGTFSIPSFVSVDAQNLIRGMVDTNQSKRFTVSCTPETECLCGSYFRLEVVLFE